MFSKRQQELFELATFPESYTDRVELELRQFTDPNTVERFANGHGAKIVHLKDITLSQINRQFRFHTIPDSEYNEDALSYYEAINEISMLFEENVHRLHNLKLEKKLTKDIFNTRKDKQLAFFYFYAGSYWTHIENIVYWRTPLVVNFLKNYNYKIHPGKTRLKISSPAIRRSKTDVIIFVGNSLEYNQHKSKFEPNSLVYNQRSAGGFGRIDLQILANNEMEMYVYQKDTNKNTLVPNLLNMGTVILKWEDNTLYVDNQPLITIEPFKRPIWHKLTNYRLINN